MGNMKQLDEFFEELKKEKMENAITVAKSYLDEGKIINAEQLIEDTLNRLDTLRDQMADFITSSDAPVLEPYHGEIVFLYKDERFNVTLSKTFDGVSSDIMHLWCTSDDLLEHIDWLCGSEELEKLVNKYLKKETQEINMVPIEFYIWTELKPWLDRYLAKKAKSDN